MARAKVPAIAAIDEALAHGDPEVALATALAIWRHARHAALADVVDAIAARCKPVAIAGRDKAAYHDAWLELAARAATDDDPRAVGALAAGLAKSVPVRDIRYLAPARDAKRNKPFLERVTALAACPDDPRVASAIVELLVRAPFSVEDVGGVYGSSIDLLIRIADERSADKLRALVARPVAKTATLRDYFAAALPKAADAIERSARRRPPVDTGAIAALAERLAAPAAAPTPSRTSVSLDRLLADCLAHPDDDAPREVYADALLERDDPRGELIQLQLRDARQPLGEPERKRMAQLLRKGEKAWLGDLTRVSKRRVWRRGFLDELELLQGASADAETWARAAADPLFATVRILHKGAASEELYRTFVFSETSRSLREIEASTALLRDLRDGRRPLEHVTLRSGLTKDALVILDDVARAGVRRVTFETKLTPAALVAQIAGWPARARFEELCAVPSLRGDAWEDPLPWLLAFDRVAPVRRLGVASMHDRTLVERGPRGLVVDIHATQEHPVLALLGADLEIERLVVRGAPNPWFPPTEAFPKAIRRLPAGTVELRDGWAPFGATAARSRGGRGGRASPPARAR